MKKGALLSAAGYITGLIIVVLLADILIPPSPAKSHQLIAVTAFLGTILGAIFYWRYRVAIALAMISLMLFTGTMSVDHMIEHMHMDVIVFLIGMMIIIGFLEEQGFFEYLLDRLVKPLSKSGAMLFAGILVLAAFMASLVDEVTSILFILALLLRITAKYDMDVVPFMIAAVISTNVGSSFTVVGNPIGVLVALSGGFTFIDFINHAFLSVGLWVLLLTVGLSLLYWRSYVSELDRKIKEHGFEFAEEELAGKSMLAPWAVFLATIGGLVVHHQLEELLHLPKNSALVGVPLVMAAVSLLLSGEKAREIVERKVEWWSLVFFMFFFATVGGIAETGVARLMANAILDLAHGNPVLIMLLALWASGILSAFMDNVLAVATFITILQALQAKLGTLAILPAWWAILFGGCYGGNMTMIGSTANIVAIGVVEKVRKRYLRFVDWLKPGLLLMLAQMTLASLLVYLRYFVLHIY